jgi:hypothetical protein
VQRIKPHSQQHEDGELQRPAEIGRDQHKGSRGNQAAADHEALRLPAPGQQPNEQRVDDAADGKAGDHQAGDRGARFTRGKQKQGDKRKQSKHRHPLQEHGAKADLGAGVGEDCQVAPRNGAKIEPCRDWRGGRPQVDLGVEQGGGAKQGDDEEHRPPAEEVRD